MGVRTGSADLPLHGGKAPQWLMERMVRLSRAMLLVMLEDYGRKATLLRFSDPFWFQAFGCALGFDWHSSGLTTTVCGALKSALRGLERETGLLVAGGKGAESRKTPGELLAFGDRTGLDGGALAAASKLVAKVDSVALQDGYQLYQHCFIASVDRDWVVVQQGMNEDTRYARRYHWASEGLTSFVEEPHKAVCCDARRPSLNLVARESAPARAAITEIAPLGEKMLPRLVMPPGHAVTAESFDARRLAKTLRRLQDAPPRDFETLLGTEALGPKTMRALTLVAEVVHGAKASYEDPARYSFAHGGKDGFPFPVQRDVYDITAAALEKALGRARLGESDRLAALRRVAAWAQAD